jgi:hypothetical protein
MLPLRAPTIEPVTQYTRGSCAGKGDRVERAPRSASSTGSPPGGVDVALLLALRADNPCFRIWHEVTGNRIRYIARRLDPGRGLHTVVTSDLTELRDLLRDALPPTDAAVSRPADEPVTKRGSW